MQIKFIWIWLDLLSQAEDWRLEPDIEISLKNYEQFDDKQSGISIFSAVMIKYFISSIHNNSLQQKSALGSIFMKTLLVWAVCEYSKAKVNANQIESDQVLDWRSAWRARFWEISFEFVSIKLWFRRQVGSAIGLQIYYHSFPRIII
jgi:hypothetical protein